MQLDSTTLIVGGCFVAWLTGSLLVVARTQIAGAPALLWWAAADFASGIGVFIVALHPLHNGLLEQMLGCALLSIAPVFVWGGFRHFANRGKRCWRQLHMPRFSSPRSRPYLTAI